MSIEQDAGEIAEQAEQQAAIKDSMKVAGEIGAATASYWHLLTAAALPEMVVLSLTMQAAAIQWSEAVTPPCDGNGTD